MGGRTDDEWLELLAEAARTGEPLTLIPKVTPEGSALRDPARADEWPDERRLPAAVLRTAVLALNAPDAQPDPRGLRVVGADVTGLLDLQFADVPVPLMLVACRLAQAADLEQVSAPLLSFMGCYIDASPWGTALDLDGAHIDQDVSLDDARVTGVVRAQGAHIGGQLSLERAQLTNPAAEALRLGHARVDQGVFLGGARVTGVVWALGAHIGGQLDLTSAHLANPAAQTHPNAQTTPSGQALNLQNARIDQDVFLRDAQVTGLVMACGAHIGGQLDLTSAQLTDPAAQTHPNAQTPPNAQALSLQSTRIDQDVFLDDARVTGVVWALGAHIGGQLSLERAQLTNPAAQTDPSARALTLHGARIDQDLILHGVTSVQGVLDLTGSSVRSLTVGDQPGAESTPQAPLAANGWTVGDLRGWLRTNRRATARWLDRRPDGERYGPQPWHELAAVYDRNGHPAEAKRLRAGAAWRTTKTAPWTARPGRLLYGVLVGYGYYPLLAAVWLLAALLAAWVVVSTNADTFVMTGSDIAPYPPLEPFAYALEAVIPPAAALAESPWAPPSGGGVYYGLIALSISGWALSVLFLAGISGILRKT